MPTKPIQTFTLSAMPVPVKDEFIKITGAREHNLKNVSLTLPRHRLIVVTGPSGSGKSSLAFDTIYAEGQRRFVETLSSYARQFLDLLQKPDVEAVSGLSPAVSIEQRKYMSGPRSTLGTTSEVYDYLRLLFAKVGIRHCLKCNVAVQKQSRDEIVAAITSLETGTRFYILAPLVKHKKGEFLAVFEKIRKEGFVKARVDGKIYDLDDEINLARYKYHTIEVVVEQAIIGKTKTERLSDSVIRALEIGGNELVVFDPSGKHEQVMSTTNSCPECSTSYEDLEPAMFSFNSPIGYCPKCHGLGLDKNERECKACGGKRLKPESLSVLLGSHSIAELSSMDISLLHEQMNQLTLTPNQEKVSGLVLKELQKRIKFLMDIGLGYLSLDRNNDTLSGGEFQRVRLATQIGSGLCGVMYVLDEPSIGLHFRDNEKLIASLENLTNLGNTVIVVEHDETTMRHADHIVDLGPGAGIHGGKLVASGPLADILACEESLTGKYLCSKLKIMGPEKKRTLTPGHEICVLGATEHNLKNVDATFPLGTLICVTGVSGSGKSTLVDDILRKKLCQHFYRSTQMPGKFDQITGLDKIDKITQVDQSPIGRSPRSNPVTYTGIFTDIRKLFAQTSQAKARGYGIGQFSFNVKGGRCEECQGNGYIKVEMRFLPDVYVPCSVCEGKRFNDATLEVTYKDKNISQVLDMTIEEACDFFENIPKISKKLEMFNKVGLGYLTLGQSATTLSGGEAQRIKLTAELTKKSTGKTLFILDEPTTGLHFADVHLLVDVLHQLVEQKNTVIVIEHNLEVIKTADHIIDMGPEGGIGGGTVIATGTPEQIVACKKSYTGQALKTLPEFADS